LEALLHNIKVGTTLGKRSPQLISTLKALANAFSVVRAFSLCPRVVPTLG
jgi:hypothetical protein